jgi:tRNA modification GTPase
MAKTMECLASADLVLWIVDCTLPLPVLPPETQAHLRPDNTLLVLNKVDLLPDPPLLPSLLPQIHISALTGQGVEELRAAIVARADSLAPALAAEEQLAVNARHADALRRAEGSLRAALAGLRSTPAQPIELVSADLRAGLDALGEIAGRVDNERMLDSLFATFCIGK